ncbi:MAG: hypothetical protein R2697_07730 [Ilumatobacteraceae bacterium]
MATTAKHQILIIGGGTADIHIGRPPRHARATPTSRSSNRRTSITTNRPGPWSAPTLFDLQKTERAESSVVKKSTWIKKAAESFDPDNNTVACTDGSTYEYEALVSAPASSSTSARSTAPGDALARTACRRTTGSTWPRRCGT